MIDRPVLDSDWMRGVVSAILAILFFLTIAAVPSHSPWNASAAPPMTPQCAVNQEDPSAWNFTISKERAPEVVWYYVSIYLIDREGPMTPQSWVWNPLPLNYTGPGPYKQSIRSTGGGTMLFCNVTDITGNNLIDSGDYFVIESNSSDFDRTAIDELTLVYKPSADPMWTGEFRDGKLVQLTEFPWMLIGIVGVAGIAVIVIVFLLMRNRKRPWEERRFTRGNRTDSMTSENQPPRKAPLASIILLVITIVFWLITNNWIAEDRHLFEFPHESALLATVILLIASVAFWEIGRIQVSRLCIGIGTACLVVAIVLWWLLMATSFGG